MLSYKQRLNQISTFIFDVDGVFTDGKVYLINDEIVRALNSKDGYAVQYAVKMGYKIFCITGGSSPEVKKRLMGLGVHDVYLGSHNKLERYEQIKKEYNLSDTEIAYMGDDIPDYPVMLLVGLACAPNDAVQEIQQIAHYVSHKKGGEGCVRDIIEQTLRVQNKWNEFYDAKI